MVEYRLLQKEEYQQASDLADKVFRKEGHVSMGIAFPQVFSSAFNQSYGAFINGRLVSFIGLVPSVLHIENAEVQAFSIGAVCTDPDYRKQGLANTLLQKIFEHIHKSSGSILFISGDLPLYIKQGCTFYGKLNQFKFQKGNLEVNDAYTVRELQPYDWFQMRKLSHKRPIRYEQTMYEMALLNESAGYASIFKMNHKVLVTEENQELTAFLIFGLPYESQENIDSCVIEWGGDPQAIKSLFASSFTYGLNSLLVNIPSFETELINQLKTINKVEKTYPGTTKIMNLDLLLNQLEPYFQGKVEITKVDENNKKLTINEDSIVLSNQEIEQLILVGNKDVHSSLQTIFPVPFPFPQGLNYV